MSAHLSALYLNDDVKDWQGATINLLRQLDLGVIEDKRRCFTWSPDNVCTLSDSATFADAIQIRSVWIGGRRRAIGLIPQRLYFDPSGERIVEREFEILKGHSRPSADIDRTFHLIETLLEELAQKRSDIFGRRINLEKNRSDLTQSISIVVRDSEYSADARLRQIFGQNGYDYVPDDMSVVVIPEPGIGLARAEQFSHQIQSVCAQNHLSVPVFTSSAQKLRTRLNELEDGSSRVNQNAPVWFLLSAKSSPPSEEVRSLMARLSSLNISWRRAYADDDFQWSVSDQLGSLLQAAGGRTYSIKLDGLELPWSIGLDLAHGSPGDPVSTVCAALVDPTGNMVRAWTIKQDKNEAVSGVAVRKLLLAAVEHAKREATDPRILILRDGRLFERENERFYKDRLGGTVTLVEIRKRQNPLYIDDTSGRIPAIVTYGEVPNTENDAHVGFLTLGTREQSKGFKSPLKIHWKDRWDGLSIGKSLPNILTALTCTPGLGLHKRSLPAPIYWADGIAGAGTGNIKFAGQRVTHLN